MRSIKLKFNPFIQIGDLNKYLLWLPSNKAYEIKRHTLLTCHTI